MFYFVLFPLFGFSLVIKLRNCDFESCWNTLILDSRLLKKYICFNDSPSKTIKNAFYFILRALFVLKIFKCLSWLFGHVGKMTWLER